MDEKRPVRPIGTNTVDAMLLGLSLGLPDGRRHIELLGEEIVKHTGKSPKSFLQAEHRTIWTCPAVKIDPCLL